MTPEEIDAWETLRLSLGEQALSDYMWMGKRDGRFAYKHKMTREYIYLYPAE